MSNLTNISLETIPDSRIIDANFYTLNNDKLEVENIIQGENIQITANGKNITISATQGAVGQDGISLQYVWNGTSLGIKREDEIDYTYVDLKGQDGSIGVDGKSAYQAWLDLGNIGTEQNFIDSIKGENGIDGRSIEMRYSETYLQYRLIGDVYWINLIQLTQPEIDLVTLTNRVDVLETNQGDLTSVPTELQNKTIAEMITTNFTSVSNGKGLIANAITDKGVNTLATDTFQTMASNIGLISGGTVSGGIDAYTKLMLHCEDFTDSSFAPRTIVNTGATIVEGFFGNAIKTEGASVNVRFGVIGEYNFLHNGTEDYTIDFRFKTILNKRFFIATNGGASANSGIYIGVANGIVTFYLSRGVGGSPALSISFTLTNASIFNHIALVKIGNVYTLYENGQPKISASPTLTLSLANHFNTIIGTYDATATENIGGIFDELRISRGIGRWAEPFTPSPSPYTEDLEAYSTMLEEQIVESEYQNL